MNGTTKLATRSYFRAGLVPLALLGAGLAINCSSSDNTTGVPSNTAGTNATAGSTNTAGANTGAGAGGGSAAGSGGQSTGGAAACTFPAGSTRCGENCVTTSNDPDFCGSCTTKCDAVQVCSESKCSASPTALVPAAAGCGALRLILSGANIVYSDEMHGTISSVPTAGGAATKLVSGEMAPTYLKLGGTNLFWIAKGTKQIRKAPLAGGAATTVSTATDELGGLTVSADGATVFYSAGTKLYKVSATANNVAGTLIGAEDNGGFPQALAYDAASKKLGFPTELNYDVDVITIVDNDSALCVSTDEGKMQKNCQRVARSQGSVNAENAYIIDNKMYWAGGAAVRSNSLTDATANNETVANSGDGNVQAFSINGMNVYFADDKGSVYVAPLTGGTDTTTKKIVRAQTGVTSIVGDGTKAYWAGGDCSIQQLALPTGGISPI